MEPIISPWLVYLVSFLANVGCAASIVLFVAITVIVLCFFISYYEEEAWNEASKIVAIALIVAIVSSVIAILIPSKNDMLTMLALSYITPDNVQLIQGNIADFVKQIAQAIE